MHKDTINPNKTNVETAKKVTFKNKKVTRITGPSPKKNVVGRKRIYRNISKCLNNEK